jgi:hypothetical protein
MATQKVVEAQEALWSPVIFEELQVVPSYCSTLPVAPLTVGLTATQKLDETQETEPTTSEPILDSELHDVPS